jgi:hypothetical protein
MDEERPRRWRRERFALVAGLRRQEGGSKLVAGEETRSREAGEHAEMPARHLMLLGAAERAADPVRPGYGDEDFHGPLPLPPSIPYGDHIYHPLVLDHGSLMEQDLPSHFCVLPEGGAAIFAYLVLNQRVGEQVDVGCAGQVQRYCYRITLPGTIG